MLITSDLQRCSPLPRKQLQKVFQVLCSGTGAAACSMSGGSTVSSNGSAETAASTLAWRKMVTTLESAAVLTSTHHSGNMSGSSGSVAVTGSVRKSCAMGWPATQPQL